MVATLAAFQGRHEGESIVVCGCGPSLTELAEPQCFVTIGVNDVGRLFDPNYLVVVNPRSQFKSDRFGHVERSKAHALFTQLDLGPVGPPVVRFKLGRYGGTDTLGTGVLNHTQNSPYVAVCLAALMGARRIGLIGVDFTDHHFFASTGRHPLATRLREIDAQYGRLAQALRQRGVELVNLSSQSLLASLPKVDVSWLGEPVRRALQPVPTTNLRIVSYATTPVAGVPSLLARCIAHATPHTAHCVWAGGSYGNGVEFSGGTIWGSAPAEANALIAAADVVIVHNGRIAPAHQALLQRKPLVTMAHNYGWNVDMQHVRRGGAGVVVGQYQVTLPEFKGWGVVPNPIPLWEPEHAIGDKGPLIHIAYTPSGRHERYPPNHRLYWHSKGFDTTVNILRRLARLPNVRIESTEHGQMSHVHALAAKRRAHIVIDECVTGSYHRNSLEGLAAGAVVVNGVGLLPGVEEALRHCAPDAERMPFEFSTLAALEQTLLGLIALGPDELAVRGRANRAWMERHWNFADQWPRFWQAACDPQRRLQPPADASIARPVRASAPPPVAVKKKETPMNPSDVEPVSVVVPHGGAERLPHLAATLATLRQRAGVGEIIVVEMGTEPLATDCARRWADKHLFVEHHGAFERARTLNAAQAVADCPLLLWHDNDLLMPPEFLTHAVRELRTRRLDYLAPYTSVRYLSEADSRGVIQGVVDPLQCRAHNTLLARVTAMGGGMGLVSRDFLQRHGGFIEGFQGWGGEDNAWSHKVSTLGRAARTQRTDQHLSHLYHPASGGQGWSAACRSNPHYAANVALMQRVCHVRNAAELTRQFPPLPPAPGVLTRFAPAATPSTDGAPVVWAYWEGACPEWIRACWRSVAAAAPNARLLTPESFDRLRDRDRDIDLSRLHVAHRADFIRMFLLQRYGGLWIDADCLAMKPLQPVLDLLKDHEMVGHRERSGLVSNGFVASRAGGRIVSAVYRRICDTLRSRRPLGWTSIGSEPLSAVIAEDATGWHGLACEQVQPVCWSRPESFFARGTEVEHEAVFDERARCYMLSNTPIRQHQSKHPQSDLMAGDSFFSFLRGRAMEAGGDADASVRADAAGAVEPYEEIFLRHAKLYQGYRDESISGPGSGLQQTQALRERLPLLLGHLGVRTLLDAPCGDFHWMRQVQLGVATYIGADILADVIADHNWRHGHAGRRFVRADLTASELPQADAILCRDLLPHLSFSEVMAVLRNFKRSGATWLLMTTFTGPRPNRDTSGGDWRTLNLTLAPFCFPAPLLVVNEGCAEGGGVYADKSLGVWRMADLVLDSPQPLSTDQARGFCRAALGTLFLHCRTFRIGRLIGPGLLSHAVEDATNESAVTAGVLAWFRDTSANTPPFRGSKARETSIESGFSYTPPLRTMAGTCSIPLRGSIS